MSRTIDQVAVVIEMPPIGTHECKCVKCEPGESKNTHTPQLRLSFECDHGTFSDDVYITPKTVNRLAIIAQRICLFPKDAPLPDDDFDCANHLATYIEQNIVGRMARVTIGEEKSNDPAKPPRRKVTFGGYAECVKLSDLTDEHGIPVDPPAREYANPDNLPL